MSVDDARSARIEAARSTVRRLFAAAVKAVDPAEAVRRNVRYEGGSIWVGDRGLEAAGGVHVAAIGKAAVAMTRGALEALGDAVVSGHAITKEGHVETGLRDVIAVHEAGHPIPDDRGVEATQTLLDHLASLGEDHVALALISGGGSALLEAPRTGVSLEDLAATTDLLLRAGAPIDALNAVRAPLSRVKAGGLRAAAPRTPWATLILSDVLGNDPRVIASGPTVPGIVEPALALSVLDRYGVRERAPASILAALESAERAPAATEPDRDILVVIGDNAAAVGAAAAQAHAEGLAVETTWTAIQGEASELGRDFVEVVDNSPTTADVLLGGGEATVTVRGDGLGGRNTEFALAAALEMEKRSLRGWVVASLGTDGQDANTGLAGAIADGWTCQRARDLGIDPEAALVQNDSVAVFEAAGGAIDTGPTGTNVNDLYFAVRVERTSSGRDKRGA